jgi:hypothetical protein
LDTAPPDFRNITEELNGISRRLKQGKSESDWCDAVLDGAARFSSAVALFSLENDALQGKGTRNLALGPATAIPLANAAAFRTARDSGELVVALCSKNEVSETIAALLPLARVYIVPISNGSRTAALLLASAAKPADSDALELIADLASFVLERRSQSPAFVQIAPPPLPSRKTEANPAVESAPDLENLSDDEKLQHVRARRLARTKVAELQLYRPEACAAGRAEKNIYMFLKTEIDSAREAFRKQFMNTRSMVDYLHLEMTRQLAHGDDALLGVDYPGQMH